jgi:hypothetical protein
MSGSRRRQQLGRDVEADVAGDDALVAEALDEVQEQLGGDDLDAGPLADHGGDGEVMDAIVLGEVTVIAHSAVTSVTAARAEDSSMMAFLAA